MNPETGLAGVAIEAGVTKNLNYGFAHGQIRDQLVVVVFSRMDSPDGIFARVWVHRDLNLIVQCGPVCSLMQKSRSEEWFSPSMRGAG